MITSRLTARRLAFLLLLPGCHQWRPVTLAPSTSYRHDGNLRIQRGAPNTNSVVYASGAPGQMSDTPIVLHRAWVDGDTLFGFKADKTTPHGIAIADVRKAEERHFSGKRTTLLVVVVGAAMFAGLVALVAATPGPSFGY